MTLTSNAVLVLTLLVEAALPQNVPIPQPTDLRTYSLPPNTHSADMSPGEDVVALESTSEATSVDGKTRNFAEVVSTFDFRHGKVLAKYTFPSTDVDANAKGRFNDPVHGRRFVRFTPDGSSIVALVADTIYLFPARNLTEVHEISVSPPPAIIHDTKNGQLRDVPKAQALEISPNGHFAAILWVIGNFNAKIDFYDMVSHMKISGWFTPTGLLAARKPGFVWGVDGSSIVMAIPNELCSAFPTQPDVFEFDAISGTVERKLATSLLSGPVALSSDDRVFTGDAKCPSVFHHKAQLRVFSLSAGKEVRTINGPGSGERYFGVVASQNRTRFLVFSRRTKTKFDWLDMTSNEVTVSEKFTVWSMADYSPVVTSQNILGLSSSDARMSPQGDFVVVAGNAYSFASTPSAVFELP